MLFAAIESAAETPGEESPFERRMLRELAAAGWAPEDVGLCLGDGAEWIRRMFDDWFPDASKVVDYHHAAEHLWAAAARATATATWPRRGRRSCAGCSRRDAWRMRWLNCGGEAATPRSA